MDKEQLRKETDLEQKFDQSGGLISHSERKVEVTQISTTTEIIQIVTVISVGLIGIIFMFVIVVGGLKLISNMTDRVEVSQ